MKQYLDNLRTVLEEGEVSTDRTGTGTISHFGLQSRYDMADGFPLVTTKKLHLKSIIHELLWFIAGDTNIRYLLRNGVRIWSEWPHKAYCEAMSARDEPALDLRAFEERVVEDESFAALWGSIGPGYGAQFRKWPTNRHAPTVDRDGHTWHMPVNIDQIAKLVRQIEDRPDSRRLIVSAWNPDEVDNMALPPCHTLWQVRIAGGKLHLQLYQRSADMFLGVPFNIASYALLLHMLAHVTGYEPGTFVHTMGDAHIYSNHVDQVNLQLSREPHPLPALKINRKVTSIFDFRFEDFEIEGYESHPTIRGQVAV